MIPTALKARVLRVDIGGIEAALLSLRSLREAVVIAREDSSGQRRLVAYVVPATAPGPR
jgi:acyl-coenzyme A synthetase/AMP-(fatty) acid ligase